MTYYDQSRLATFGLALLVLVAVDKRATGETLSSESELSVAQLSKVMADENCVVVDTRATDAYNGWALEGIQRGGHIPHAVDFPASWLDIDNATKKDLFAARLREKEIERNKRVVLYSIAHRDRNRVGNYLKGRGFKDLYYFDFQRWLESEYRPLERYPNYHLLVPPVIMKQLVDGHLPETFENATRIKFVEVSWGDEDASYSKGHVPRSFHVNTDHFEPPPKWMLGGERILTEFAMKYGFQTDDTVIISAEDPTASYRLAIVLQYMGVRDVRVLNGGFKAWKKAKYPIDIVSHSPPRAKSFGAKIPMLPRLIVDTDRVKAGLRTPSEFALVDNRTWAEFTGEKSGYEYHWHKGRIPGSVYGQADFTGPNSLTPYRNVDDTMRNADEIRNLWSKSGIDTDKELCFMCGSGWRAAEVLTFALVIGIPNTSLYSDGWIRWSNDRTNSVETGAYKKRPEPAPGPVSIP